jgi:hypothetical protein
VGNRVTATIAWLLAASAAWLSCGWLVAAVPLRTPIDDALPLLGVMVVAIAWAARRTPYAAAITMGVPLLMAAELAVAGERLRLFLIGAVVAAALAAAVASLAGRQGIATSSARLLALLTVLMMRLVGWHPELRDVVQTGIVLAGVAALIQLFASPMRRVPIAWLALAIVVGLVTPSFPFAASLYPPVLALLGVVVRAMVRESPRVRESSEDLLDRPLLYAAASGAIILSTAGGRWLLSITAVTLLAAIIARFRSPVVAVVAAVSAMALIPARAYASLASLRAWSAAPFVVSGAAASSPLLLTSLFLTVLAVVARPTVAPLIAIAIAVLSAAVVRPSRLSGATPLFAFLMVALVAWSGIPARVIPMPLGLSALALIAAAAIAGRFAVVVAAAGVILVFMAPWRFPDPVVGRVEPVGIALAPGASFTFDGEPPAAVIVSGANVAHLRVGTLLGLMAVIDSRGRESRRDIRIGDASDWGFLRQGLYFFSRNPLPREPRQRLIGYGYDAFLTGGGRIPTVPAGGRAARVRIIAASSLPPTARLQIDGLERAP